MNQNTIYKVLHQSDWETMLKDGQFNGAPIDLQDGYIHFSTGEQLVETVAKHFRSQKDLVVVAVDAASLGSDLRWEVSRGGALFPHLYAPLRTSSVTETFGLPLDEHGQHIFPADRF